MRLFMTLAALSGFFAVAFGAFAAHGAEGEAARLLQTGSQYQMAHALAVFAAATLAGEGRPIRWVALLFLVGTLLFSFTLYAMALGGPGILGMITPVGGLCFLAGWLTLAWTAWRSWQRAS